MHHSHRTWFPFILTGLSIILLLVIICLYSDGTPGAQEILLEPAEYQDAVGQVFDQFQESGNALEAYDSLLEMKVQEEQKQVHLDLVLMFGKLYNGEIDSIDQTLMQLQIENQWLIE